MGQQKHGDLSPGQGMKRRNFLKGAAAGLAAAPALSIADLFARLKPEAQPERIPGQTPAPYTGTSFYINGHLMPNVLEISVPESQMNEIDVTNLDSSSEGYYGRIPLPDYETIGLKFVMDSDSAGMLALQKARLNQDCMDCMIMLSDSPQTKFKFDAYCADTKLDLDPYDLATIEARLRIVGAVTIT